MPQVEADHVLDPIVDSLGQITRDRGITFVAAVARTDERGNIIVRCKGYSVAETRQDARAMVECLEALTELRATVDAPAQDPELVH